ncbi:unnamed protein product [Meganyctiphanes norvegica]|uniref:Uncharacterized protein n=1 Tax=Meganyctiphanes norvegica TaxID=48144 RepID=A0AAV2QV68_MEGNR
MKLLLPLATVALVLAAVAAAPQDHKHQVAPGAAAEHLLKVEISPSTSASSVTPTEPLTSTAASTTTTDDGTGPTDDGGDDGDEGLSDGEIAGIVIGSLAGVGLIGGGVFFMHKKKMLCF